MYSIKKLTKGYAVLNSKRKIQSTHSEYSEAQDACQRYVEDDQWRAANRD